MAKHTEDESIPEWGEKKKKEKKIGQLKHGFQVTGS
jgi:hypothetical protein